MVNNVIYLNIVKKINVKWFDLVKLVMYVIISGGKNFFKLFIIDMILFVDLVLFKKYDGINLKIKLLLIFV